MVKGNSTRGVAIIICGVWEFHGEVSIDIGHIFIHFLAFTTGIDSL